MRRTDHRGRYFRTGVEPAGEGIRAFVVEELFGVVEMVAPVEGPVVGVFGAL